MQNASIPTHRPKMRTKEAARYSGSTESTLTKLRLTGGGPIYITIGRTVVYDPDDLDAWLASKRRKSTSVAA
jgi:predicted DNA-binding transcriptional regulator AlpA